MNGEKKTRPDQPDQPVFELLQRAWKEFATGVYTKAEIRRLMASWGIITRQGTPMPPQSLDNLFRNPYYAGILIDPWSGEEYKGQHVPMVTRQDFARVQQIVAKRKHSIPHQKERPEFPLRGLVRCNGCHGYMTAAFSRGRSKRYPYYLCKNRSCSASRKNHPAHTVHEEYEVLLQRLSFKPELRSKLETLILEVAGQRYNVAESSRVSRDRELVKVQRETNELIRMRTQAIITDPEFIEQRSRLLERRLALEASAVDETYSPAKLQQSLDRVLEPLHNLKQARQDLSELLLRRFDRLVLPAGFVIGESRTAQTALIFRFFEASLGGSSHGVDLAGEKLNRVWQEIQEFLRLFKTADRARKA